MVGLLLCSLELSAEPESAPGGYPVANFALTVNVTEDGDMFGQVLRNPGELGEWLEDMGAVEISVRNEDGQHSLSGFGKKDLDRSFPVMCGRYSDSPVIGSDIGIKAFCPLSINDAETSSLPVLMTEFTVSNTTRRSDSFSIVMKPDPKVLNDAVAYSGDGAGIALGGVSSRSFHLSCDAASRWADGCMEIPVSLSPGETGRIRVILSYYDDRWVTARNFGSADGTAEYAFRMWDVLDGKTELFSSAIPRTGMEDIDSYIRWYMVPAVSLTKYTRDGDLLTMGYCELNQRDSYWTTWTHLVLFRDVEKKMIDESAAAQLPTGKIPTTILPVIDRDDDLDINAFFILRATRFYQYYHDRTAMEQWWTPMKKAMDWLVSRDTGGVGLPRQVSFWGDWKDVPGVEDRAYSPFSCLIYLAALKEMQWLASELGDIQAGEKYAEAYARGYERINRPVEDGGMWNGRYYCQIWKDGSVNDRLLQDQTIGIMFGVVPRDRAVSIVESLNDMSLTKYGVAETWPYYPESFGYEPATYHNGAVWPWVSFMDCWARTVIGRDSEAADLVRTVAKADLIDSGDWSPNEHINSLTGENLGYHIQGWNAALFGLAYFGFMHPGIIR